ncbi:beta-defensin 110-like [Ochotona curzoniae]|uniref:beta-defensin 110-like n=1 Tax=Ochotona curzoniae TaxID=130825 RepID=UPI001B34CDBF|nr:beta-defensin 110-like [Ochotona curzoniae]
MTLLLEQQVFISVVCYQRIQGQMVLEEHWYLGAGSNLSPKYRFERCQKVKGISKPFCDDVEYDYGYCIKWRNQCCI